MFKHFPGTHFPWSQFPQAHFPVESCRIDGVVLEVQNVLEGTVSSPEAVLAFTQVVLPVLMIRELE